MHTGLSACLCNNCWTYWTVVAKPGRKLEVSEIIKFINFCENRKPNSFPTGRKAAAHAQLLFDAEVIHLGQRLGASARFYTLLGIRESTQEPSLLSLVDSLVSDKGGIRTAATV